VAITTHDNPDAIRVGNGATMNRGLWVHRNNSAAAREQLAGHPDAVSRPREPVTDHWDPPNLFEEAHVMCFANGMEPDHVKETHSHDFTSAAARGDVGNSPGRIDDYRQELLAK
jgi:hypothetical protein